MKLQLLSLVFLTQFSLIQAQSVTLENNQLKVIINNSDGNFTLTHKESGKTWLPDPWIDKAAGFIEIISKGSATLKMNLSKSASVQVSKINDRSAQIRFENFKSDKGDIIKGSVEFKIEIPLEKPDMNITLVDFSCIDGKITRIEYPARHFSLKWEKDRGMAVIPTHQGVIFPSFLFPRPNSKFGYLDDYMGETKELSLYHWTGLSMPWFGIYDQKSAVITVIPDNRSVSLQYTINSNNENYWHGVLHTEVKDPRILVLTPVWSINREPKNQTLHYHFINRGTYVEMAKYYRQSAIKKGLFVSLETKVKKQPDIDKMKGAVYFHMYGGYPHYVNNDEMDFTFDELEDVIKDIHDNKKLSNAIINIWGAYENYPPNHLPYNLKAGGEAKIKAVYDLAKNYGYLITSYHSWHATLEYDPLYDPDWIKRDASGTRSFANKWGGSMDPVLWIKHAKHLTEYEIPALKPNLFYSDGAQNPEVARFTTSFNLPVTNERMGDSEQLVKEYACLEGVAPYNMKDPVWSALEVPLFNLVYHDAIFTTNRWQSPDNDYDMNGDFPTRTLRNMLYGNIPVFVVPLWEYPGIAGMIEMVKQTASPWNRDVAFAELTSHEFLTSDHNVQRSRFSNGAEVTVNFALCEHKLPDGDLIPGYGFIMKFSDGSIKKGSFKTSVVMQ